MLLLAGLELLEVEVELLALKDVAVSAARLAGARSDHGEETTSAELLGEVGVNLGVLLALGKDALDVVRLLDLLGLGGGGSRGLGADNGLGVVGLVPLTEGGGVNLNDARLDEGLGTEKLVVGRVVALRRLVLGGKMCDLQYPLGALQTSRCRLGTSATPRQFSPLPQPHPSPTFSSLPPVRPSSPSASFPRGPRYSRQQEDGSCG